MRQFDEATLTAKQQSCTEQLARFFPDVASVHVLVEVIALRGGKTRLREDSVVEFAAPENAIFISTLPLEFDDRIRLEGTRKGCTADATVVAVQYHDGRKAVAVKFLSGPCTWMTQS